MSDPDDIRGVILKSEALWNRQDYAGLKALWDAEDPEPWYAAEEIEERMVGLPAIEAYWAANVTLLDRITVAFSNLRVKLLGPDVAVAFYDLRFDLKLAGPRKPLGGDNRVVAVLRRRAGGWLFSTYVEAPLSPIIYIRRLYELNVRPEFAKDNYRASDPHGTVAIAGPMGVTAARHLTK